jgi:phosphatidylglycerophosphate synthase
MPSSQPSIAELRAVCQPDTVVGRASGEHWAGRLYMRHVSIYLTRVLLPTPITPDAVTWGMLLSGVAAAAALANPGLGWAIGAFLLIQLQQLLDCSDGEIARWRKITGATGVYLDRIGHYVTDASLIIALGIRADGGFDSIGGWTTWTLLGAVIALINKGETDLVHVARAVAELPKLEDRVEVAQPRTSALAAARRVARVIPFHRVIGAQELTMLSVVVSIVDLVIGEPVATRWFALAITPLAAVVAAGHLAGVLSSSRLR